MSEAAAPAATAAETEASAAPKKRRSELALFALPHATLGALALPPIVFLPPYFAASLGIPLAIVSIVFLSARSLDIILDPLIGSWQDRTRSRFGRRRTWLIAATPILMAFVWLAFIGVGRGADPVHLALVMFAFYISYATMLIAHLGWASELRADYHGRTNVLGAVQLAGMIGAMLILLLPGLVRQFGGGSDADAVHVMGWTLIIAIPALFSICILFVREPDVAPQPRLPLRAAFDALVTNSHLRQVLAPDLLLGIAQGVSGGLFLFYFQYVLGFESQSQTLLFIYFISGVAGVPIWIWLGRKIGKHRALQAACVYAAIVTIGILAIPAGQFFLAAAGMFTAGLHQGSSALLLRSMLADVVDEDVVKTGARRAGLFNGLMLTTSKVGLATGPITYAILDLFDFDPMLGAGNTPEAMGALVWLFIGAPALLFALGALVLNYYKLDETHQKALRAEIDARSLS